VTAVGALGTKAGETYADGGTLLNAFGNWNTGGNKSSFPDEHVHLNGTGFANMGALSASAACVDICKKITLEGDTLIGADQRIDLRMTTLTMNGHHLTVRGDFRFVVTTFVSPGDVTACPTYFELQGACTYPAASANTTFTIKTGTRLGFWSSSKPNTPKLVFEDGTALSGDSGPFNYMGTGDCNVLCGSKVLQGAVKNAINKGVQVQLRGAMTGEGGIVPGTIRGGWLQLADYNAGDAANNSYKGGVSAQGIVTNGTLMGGIVTYRNGAIPAGAEAGPVTLDDAQLYLRTGGGVNLQTKGGFALPDLVVKGSGIVTNDGTLTSCTVKSLVKSGDGTLDVKGPFRVTGNVDVRGGTFRCASPSSDVVPGMLWVYNKSGAVTEQNEATLAARSDFQGVDPTGLGYAYKAWPTKNADFFDYIGYFKVPETTAGEQTRCRIIADLWRYVKVWVDGVKVLEINDDKLAVPANTGINIGWTRHFWTDPFHLSPGWHKIVVSMSGLVSDKYWDNGPNSCSSADYGLWPANFGLGIDFNSSETRAKDWATSDATKDSITNAAHYVKFLDPGDGSFVRATTNSVKNASGGLFTSANCRPVFDGSVAFGGGTVLDLNDVAPYSVMTFASLAGLPTIRRGAVNVTSTTWTVRPDDLQAGVPLTVDSDASLTFAGAKTVTVDGDPEAFALLKKMSRGKPIFKSDDLDSYTFTLSPRMKEINCWLGVKDGVLCLYRGVGMMLQLR